jgi:hypothetical protein
VTGLASGARNRARNAARCSFRAFVNVNALDSSIARAKSLSGEGNDRRGPLIEQKRQDTTERVRAAIEEELGKFRRFADVPAVEIEEMAARIARAIAPLTGGTEGAASRAA